MKELKRKYRLFIAILLIAIIYTMLICHFSNNMLKIKVEEKAIEIENLRNDIDTYNEKLRIYENGEGMDKKYGR